MHLQPVFRFLLVFSLLSAQNPSAFSRGVGEQNAISDHQFFKSSALTTFPIWQRLTPASVSAAFIIRHDFGKHFLSTPSLAPIYDLDWTHLKPTYLLLSVATLIFIGMAINSHNSATFNLSTAPKIEINQPEFPAEMLETLLRDYPTAENPLKEGKRQDLIERIAKERKDRGPFLSWENLGERVAGLKGTTFKEWLDRNNHREYVSFALPSLEITNPFQEESSDLSLLATKEAQSFARQLRSFLQQSQFDEVNEMWRQVLPEGYGHYHFDPLPIRKNFFHSQAGMLELLRGLSESEFEQKILNWGTLFNFFRYGHSVTETELKELFGISFESLLTEGLKLQLFVKNPDGTIRTNNLSLVSKHYPQTKEAVYVFVDTPHHISAPRVPPRVYIGPDSYALEERLYREHFSGHILEVGSGSGFQLFSILKRSPDVELAYGLEIDQRALSVSRFNAVLNELENCVIFCSNESELAFQLGERKVNFILSNPAFMPIPDKVGISAYLSDAWRAVTTVFTEDPQHPTISLKSLFAVAGWGGEDGLQMVRRIGELINFYLAPNGQAILFGQFLGTLKGPEPLTQWAKSFLPQWNLEFEYWKLGNFLARQKLTPFRDFLKSISNLVFTQNPFFYRIRNKSRASQQATTADLMHQELGESLIAYYQHTPWQAVHNGFAIIRRASHAIRTPRFLGLGKKALWHTLVHALVSRHLIKSVVGIDAPVSKKEFPTVTVDTWREIIPVTGISTSDERRLALERLRDTHSYGRVLVLGVGPAADVPLLELALKYEEVFLVDIEPQLIDYGIEMVFQQMQSLNWEPEIIQIVIQRLKRNILVQDFTGWIDRLSAHVWQEMQKDISVENVAKGLEEIHANLGQLILNPLPINEQFDAIIASCVSSQPLRMYFDMLHQYFERKYGFYDESLLKRLEKNFEPVYFASQLNEWSRWLKADGVLYWSDTENEQVSSMGMILPVQPLFAVDLYIEMAKQLFQTSYLGDWDFIYHERTPDGQLIATRLETKTYLLRKAA